MDNIKLKPCPFCGNKAVLSPTPDGKGNYFIHCSACPAAMVWGVEQPAVAAAVWNRRATRRKKDSHGS